MIDARVEAVKKAYEDGLVEINGREYHFSKVAFPRGRVVLGVLTKYSKQLSSADFSFFGAPDFAEAEKIINNSVLFDGNLLSRIPDHWDTYPEDYIQLITMAMSVISHPFLRGKIGD